MQEQCPNCGGYYVQPQYPYASPATQVLAFIWLLSGAVITFVLIAEAVTMRKDATQGIAFLLGGIVVCGIAIFPYMLLRQHNRTAAAHQLDRACRQCGFQWTAN